MKILISIFLAILSFQPSMSSADTEGDIWGKLKNGGLVVLMRHTHTSVKDTKPLLRDPSCVRERNLSETGKKEAARIGKMFATKGVPVSKVLTSPYCRTMDTAKIAFGSSQPVEFLTVLEALPWEQAEENTVKLTQKIGSYSGSGNLVLVTHAPNINAISFETVEMGAFLVLQPAGGHEFEEIGIINLAN
jgi:phosphohistidine phosphatase SixA